MSKDKNIESIYPLSPMQSGMLFHTLYEPDSGVYFEQIIFRLQGNINRTAFQDAWQKVVDRHAVLRTLFVWEKSKKPLQVVQKQVELPWLNLDWKGQTPDEQEKQLETFLHDDCRKSFKLNKAPLMRCTLILLTDDTYYFVWSHHHILIDGWCSPIIFKEVIAFYNNLCLEHSLTLDTVRPYKNYITWLQKQDRDAAEKFWKERMNGFVTPTPLPFDKSPVVEKLEKDYKSEKITLSKVLTLALNDLARRNRITLNSLLQIAWAIMLGRYSNEKEIVFGAIVSGRPVEIEGVESMLGLFINTLPVRLSLPSNVSILTLAKELYAQQVIQNQYSYTPLTDIQALIGLESHLPLFESIMAFENYPVDKSQSKNESGIKVLDSRIVERTNYPLNVLISPDSELFIKLLYDANRFEESTVCRMLSHLRTILEEIAGNPKQRVSDLSILTKAESEQILMEWNETSTTFPDNICVHTSFERIVEKYPEKAAFIFNDEKLTYRELNSKANVLAKELQRLGVGPDVFVGVLMERSPEMVIGIIAVVKSGGAYVPLDPSYPKERIVYMLEDSKSAVLLTRKEFIDDFTDMNVHLIELDRDIDTSHELDTSVPDLEPGNPVSAVTSDNLVYTIYTSGSTGQPKGVMISHKSLQNLVTWHQKTFHVESSDRTTLTAGPAFDASVLELWPYLCSGSSIYILDPELSGSAPDLQDWFLSNKISMTFLSTPLAEELLSRDWPRDTALKTMLTGGDRLRHYPPSSHPFDLVNNYGPTENTVVVSSGLISDENNNRLPHIGRPIDNVHIYILDNNLQPVPVGITAELHVGGAGLALGYLNRPGLTAEKFVPNPFACKPGDRLYKTGDLARYLPDGNIEFIGRNDFQVKIRGFRIELGEIESTLLRHKTVEDAVAIVEEDKPGIRRLVVYVVCTLTKSELREYLKTKLPDHMIPSSFIFMDKIPTTANGKIDRKALSESDLSKRSSEKEYVEPSTHIEKTLCGIWADILHVEQVGIHDNFFELGGDSIISIQILSQASKSGLKFTLKQLFQYPTIAELSSFVSTGSHVAYNDKPLTGIVPLTPIQQWFFEMNMTKSHHFNQSMFFEVTHDLTSEFLEQIVQQLLITHDVLRLRFTQEGNVWRQEYTVAEKNLLFATEDLSKLLSYEQEMTLESLAAKYQSSLNLSEGPLARFILFDLGSETNRLLIIIHHLVVDGVSWRILLDDLHTAYQQLKEGQPVKLPPKTSSFKLWGEKLMVYANSNQVKNELNYWLDDPMFTLISLPIDYPYDKERNTSASCDNVLVSLNREYTTELLHDVPKVYNTQINDILLTALLLAFGQWTGKKTLSIELEGHGREELFEDVDMSRTVGWFTALYPTVLGVQNNYDLGNAIKSIKEQLRQIPNKGLGFGLLKYLNRDDEIRSKLYSLPQPEISFNYLGQFDTVFSKAPIIKPAKESAGSDSTLLGKRNHLLNMNGLITDGVLKMNWTYSGNVHKKETIEQLAHNYMSILQSLIDHCRSPETGGYTVSDFPGAKLKQDELESFLDEL